MSARFQSQYGPWAIVTGASSGIGEAFAHALAARNVRPLLVARREQELQRVAAAVKRNSGIDCDYIALDLASPAFIDELERYCEGREIGLVISNAAFNPAGAFLDRPREDVLRMLDVNDRATVLLAHCFLSKMSARRRGGFMLIGSTEGFSGSPYSAVYSASKAFVQSLGEALWGEFKSQGVDVLVLSPGATDTPLLASRNASDMPGVMSPRVVADYGLDRLAKGPGAIPGALNRWMARVFRLLPRKWVVSVMGVAMKKIVSGLNTQ